MGLWIALPLVTMLHAHSPRPLLSGLHAPTMLVQGMADSLFGIEQADETARAIQAQVPRLSVRWIDGGHDGVSSTAEADEQALRAAVLAHFTAWRGAEAQSPRYSA